MKPVSQSKTVIIGMGFLMEYIFPCFQKAMGDGVAEQILAVTTDAGDLEGKKQRMGIQVILDDNAGALGQMNPDLILFAPPPSVAPQLIREVLAPYYEIRRAAGEDLPTLLAFPPSPAGKFYLEELGMDAQVANIIPNMISSVGDEPVPTESCHLITYPEGGDWPESDKEELNQFFTPMGRPLEVPTNLKMQVLATEIGAHPLTELADVMARCLTARGISCTYAQTASVMRAWHQKEHNYRAPGTNHCDLGDVADPGANQFLRAVMLSWYNGLHGYITDQGFGSASAFLDPLFDLYFHEAQLEDRETIVAKAKKDATKGGMLELCMESYFAVVEPMVEQLAAAPDFAPDQREIAQIGTRMVQITAAVVERGYGMTADKVPAFSPDQHAAMFGLLAKEILAQFGQEEGDALLLDAVARYGWERGSRMAQRCEAHGDPLDMVGYFAYTEWRWDDGFRKSTIQTEPYFAHYVHECPWCTGWKHHGLEAYGQYYCRNVDENIVRGFSPDLKLEMASYLSGPQYDCCEFHWKDAVMNEENGARQKAIAEKIGDSCLRDFIYHTAHIYAILLACAKEKDRGKGEAVETAVCTEFAKMCSWQELLKVLAQAGQDFML